MNQKIEIKESTIKRIGGYLHRVVPIADKSGEIINYALMYNALVLVYEKAVKNKIGEELSTTDKLYFA